MARRLSENDWTEARVRAFWDNHSKRPHPRDAYFSSTVGAGIVRVLAQAGALRGRVLDYGCGRGFLCEHLVGTAGEAAIESWGCDSSDESVAATNALLGERARWHGAVSTKDVARLGAHFDLVTCIETIEHVPVAAEAAFLGDLRTLLAPDGRLFVTTPNDEELASSEIYCPFCDSSFHNMQHVRSFDARSLRSTLEAHGFVVEEIGTLNFGELQASRPSLLDASPRAIARAARNAAFRAFDRVTGRRFPSLFRVCYRSAKLPHLCAFARRS